MATKAEARNEVESTRNEDANVGTRVVYQNSSESKSVKINVLSGYLSGYLYDLLISL